MYTHKGFQFENNQLIDKNTIKIIQNNSSHQSYDSYIGYAVKQHVQYKLFWRTRRSLWTLTTVPGWGLWLSAGFNNTTSPAYIHAFRWPMLPLRCSTDLESTSTFTQGSRS